MRIHNRTKIILCACTVQSTCRWCGDDTDNNGAPQQLVVVLTGNQKLGYRGRGKHTELMHYAAERKLITDYINIEFNII